MHSWTWGCRSRSCWEGAPSFTFRTERETGASGHWHFVDIKILHPWSNFSPAEDKSKGAAVSGRTLGPAGKFHGQCTREGAAEPRPRPASVTRTSWHQLRHQKKPPLPSLLGQKHFPSLLKGVSILPHGKEPTSSRTEVPPAPAQPQQLQAWLGMEMCSCHRNSSPEPAFGYQPWVWFEILPEENLHPLAEPSSLSHQLQPFSVLQFQCTPSRRSTSSSSLTPQQKPDWPQISPEPVPELYFHCSPPSKRRAGEIICEKADPEPCEPSSPLLCPFSHQPGGR